MRLRPKILLDVKPSLNTDIYGRRQKRVNLSYTPKKHSYFLKPAAFVACAVILPVLFFSSVLAPITGGTLAQTTDSGNTSAEKRQELLGELEKLEKQIAESEQIIDKYRQQGNSLQGEIKALNAKVNQLNLKIKAINLSLQKLDDEILLTNGKINKTESNISSNKLVLTEIIQSLYESDDQGLLEILIKNPKLSDFFNNVNDMATVQEGMRVTLQRYVSLKEDLSKQKEELSLERADKADLKAYQDAQKKMIANTKIEKDSLLKITKGKESEYQKLLVETKKTAAQIRSQIFELVGGGEMNFETAYSLAKTASQATGVRAALILAVLDRESALGKNVGKCDYKTAMHPKRDIPVFLEIIKKLDLQKDLDSGVIKVSCANADGVYGGAMGPAQFIPSTWKGYENRVSDITGRTPANPWDNGDAFIATALYLKDAGAAVNERTAAAKYYCGGNWNRYVCTNVYGQGVVNRAKEFQKDIDILNS